MRAVKPESAAKPDSPAAGPPAQERAAEPQGQAAAEPAVEEPVELLEQAAAALVEPAAPQELAEVARAVRQEPAAAARAVRQEPAAAARAVPRELAEVVQAALQEPVGAALVALREPAAAARAAPAGTSGGGAGGTAGTSGGGTGGTAGGGGAPALGTFADVRALFDTRCATCHNGTGGGATRVKLSDNFAGATPLSDADLYTTLTTALPGTVPSCIGQLLVVPNSVADSVIVSKVSSATPVCGAQMPFNCATIGNANAPCLTSDEINVITAWINADAHRTEHEASLAGLRRGIHGVGLGGRLRFGLWPQQRRQRGHHGG